MKKTLGFSIVWTVLAAIGTVGIWMDASWAEDALEGRVILTTFSIFGLFFIWWSWRRYKRYQSVREVETEAGKQFTWIDLNGEKRMSTIDPRIQWDEDDRLDDK